jgi:hypothetical protein
MRKNAKEKEVNTLPCPEEQKEEERTRSRIADLGSAAVVLRTVGVEGSSEFVEEEDDGGEWRCRSKRTVPLWAEGGWRSVSLASKRARAPHCVSAELRRRTWAERRAAARRVQGAEGAGSWRRAK